MPEVRAARAGDAAGRAGPRSAAPRPAEHWEREWAALDIRHVGVDRSGLPEDPEHPARARLWIRVDGDARRRPDVQQAAFTYASDLTLLGAALVPHGIHIASPRLQPASLDHTIWFHRPFRADEWWLYDQFSPFAGGGRGLALARVFTAVRRAGRDGGPGGPDPAARRPAHSITSHVIRGISLTGVSHAALACERSCGV